MWMRSNNTEKQETTKENIVYYTFIQDPYSICFELSEPKEYLGLRLGVDIKESTPEESAKDPNGLGVMIEYTILNRDEFKEYTDDISCIVHNLFTDIIAKAVKEESTKDIYK